MSQAITQLQMQDLVYAKGTVNADLASGAKQLTEEASAGITKTNATTYTVVTKGLYYIRAEQLVSDGGAIYFSTEINGATSRYGYVGGWMGDTTVSETRVLNVGDTIRIVQINAVDSAWWGQHSGYQIIMLQRMV